MELDCQNHEDNDEKLLKTDLVRLISTVQSIGTVAPYSAHVDVDASQKLGRGKIVANGLDCSSNLNDERAARTPVKSFAFNLGSGESHKISSNTK